MDTESVNVNVNLNIEHPLETDVNKIRIMTFIYNALQDGWNVVKQHDKYIFIKKHEGRKEILSDDYLKKFIAENFSRKLV